MSEEINTKNPHSYSDTKKQNVIDDTYKLGFHDDINYSFKAPKGLTRELVAQISEMKGEPTFMRNFRLRSYDTFLQKNMPMWMASEKDINAIKFDEIYYYLTPTDKVENNWADVPDSIKKTFDRIGVPQAEREFLGGVKSQYDSTVVYGSLIKELEDQGVVFLGTDEALKKFPEIFKEYFGTIVPAADNKFAALNSAVWSGGSFVYIPKGVRVDRPLQAYFRINAANAGQFERTLIIAEEDSFVHYVEGCSAPSFSSGSLHSAVVEIIVKKGARVRYTTIQNWYKNVFNLVTKRAVAHENATMEWVDGNIGSRLTVKFPSVYLVGPGAKGEILSIAYAAEGQHQHAGGKVIHAAPNTSSRITSKSISARGGRASYRGLVEVKKGCENSRSRVECDALLLDETSRTDTYPVMKINESNVNIEHEATVSKVGEEQLFYLMSRGLSKAEAMNLVVSGFIEPIVKELPLEYAVELNKLIELEMEGSVG
ncbi:MAG: Fe-S cluster assembly protein SufB [Patescibacteria group bacterium]